jgi:hypothetical protein
MDKNSFIHKYTYLCDKNHRLLINFGNMIHNNCFNNHLNIKQITNLLNYLEQNKYPIINNERGQIAVYHNEYFNITNNSITEYTIIDSIIDKNMIIKFTQIDENKNICSFKNNPNDEYDYDLVTIELNDGCYIDILKKYNNDNIIKYAVTLYVSKPCNILSYIENIIKVIN